MSEVEQKNDYIELVERLSGIQSKIALGKDLKGYGYQYRNAEQILQAVKPLLKGCVVLCTDTIDETGKLTATATIHYKTASLSVTGHAYLSEHKGMSKEQIVGCASSYARKYALQGLLAISDGADDPDGLQPENRQPETKEDKVYKRAMQNLAKCKDLSVIKSVKNEMINKMPEFKLVIERAAADFINEMQELHNEALTAANSHNDDDCPF